MKDSMQSLESEEIVLPSFILSVILNMASVIGVLMEWNVYLLAYPGFTLITLFVIFLIAGIQDRSVAPINVFVYTQVWLLFPALVVWLLWQIRLVAFFPLRIMWWLMTELPEDIGRMIRRRIAHRKLPRVYIRSESSK